MNHNRVFVAALMAVAFAAVGVVSSAHAAQPGFYVGGQYGQVSKETKIRDFDVFAQQNYDDFGLTVTSGTSSLDDKDRAYGFFGGYRFNPHFAVEGSYLNIGNVKYRSRVTGNIDGVPSPGAVNLDGQTAGIAVSALGIWPLSYRWEVYGRAGVLFASNTDTLYYADVEGPLRVEFSKSSVDAVAGIGTSLNFLEIYDFRVEFQRVFDAGHKTTGEDNVDMITVGVTVSF